MPGVITFFPAIEGLGRDAIIAAEFARRYYEKNQTEEAGQSRVKAGTLSL